MTGDPTRRFTDREVAIVLRKASEIDEREGGGAAGGLSLEDLREIAREVGISSEAVERAVSQIDERGGLPARWAGAPLARRAVRAVPGELDRQAIADLVRVVDERTDSAGAISEALGSVRWTGSDRLKSSLVSFTPEDGETRIEVVEKSAPRLRRALQLVPAAWGAILAAPLIEAAGSPFGALAVAGLGIAAGAWIGRAFWSALSRRSARRVDRLATELARLARGAAADTLPPAETPPQH